MQTQCQHSLALQPMFRGRSRWTVQHIDCSPTRMQAPPAAQLTPGIMPAMPPPGLGARPVAAISACWCCRKTCCCCCGVRFAKPCMPMGSWPGRSWPPAAANCAMTAWLTMGTPWPVRLEEEPPTGRRPGWSAAARRAWGQIIMNQSRRESSRAAEWRQRQGGSGGGGRRGAALWRGRQLAAASQRSAHGWTWLPQPRRPVKRSCRRALMAVARPARPAAPAAAAYKRRTTVRCDAHNRALKAGGQRS